MFSSLCIAALATTFVNALTINTPSNLQSGTQFQLTWTDATGDPSLFSVFLNHPSFNNVLGVANDLNTGNGNATVSLPSVPAEDGYFLEATSISNVSDVLSQTSSFSIAAAPNTTSSSASTSGTGTSSGASTGSNSASTTNSNSGSGSITNTASSSGSTTTSPSSSQSGSSTSSGANTQTSTGSAAIAVKFGFNGVGVTAVTLAMMAGAAVVAF